ncbi:MAG: hypothetical protein DMG40_05225 [Acidobacteria bacterium]|nr:MAG: hypothetical protein DMG40_05225 [Acidobacteriota bacterium]
MQETPVYVASAWWRNCEPFVTIVGGSQKAVETTIQAVMLQTATDAYNEQGSKKRERDDFLLDMARSFAKRDTLGNVFPAHVLENYCSEKLLRHRYLDYQNFHSLVNGDPNAIVRF